jgi:hypothetical protein
MKQKAYRTDEKWSGCLLVLGNNSNVIDIYRPGGSWPAWRGGDGRGIGESVLIISSILPWPGEAILQKGHCL